MVIAVARLLRGRPLSAFGGGETGRITRWIYS
jgi:hypothetical protein